MTITVNTLGANSADFAYTAGETPANMIASIGSWLTSHGWTLHDGGSYNVYKALCFDGTTYKYAQLFSNNSTNLFVRVYETWNATTHVGTNEAQYWVNTGTSVGSAFSSVTTQTPFSAAGGYITVCASNRYLLMYPKDISNVWTAPTNGCVEWSTDYTDASGVPFGWIYSGGMLGTYMFMSGATTNRAFGMISPVRSLGLTAAPASRLTAIQAYNYNAAQLVFVSGAASFSGTYGIGLNYQLPTTNNATTNLPQSFTLDVVKHQEVSIGQMNVSGGNNNFNFVFPQQALGRIYGVKIVAGLTQSWVAGDTCDIMVDANGFQVTSGGTAVTHHTSPCYSALTTARIAVPV